MAFLPIFHVEILASRNLTAKTTPVKTLATLEIVNHVKLKNRRDVIVEKRKQVFDAERAIRRIARFKTKLNGREFSNVTIPARGSCFLLLFRYTVSHKFVDL